MSTVWTMPMTCLTGLMDNMFLFFVVIVCYQSNLGLMYANTLRVHAVCKWLSMLTDARVYNTLYVYMFWLQHKNVFWFDFVWI